MLWIILIVIVGILIVGAVVLLLLPFLKYYYSSVQAQAWIDVLRKKAKDKNKNQKKFKKE